MRSILIVITIGLTLYLATLTIGGAASPTALEQERLSVVVTSPSMNADLGDCAEVRLVAAPSAAGKAISSVEFLDDDRRVGIVSCAPYELNYRLAPPKLNYRFTARVTDAAGHTAISAPVTCVATRKLERRYQSYQYEEMGERNLFGQIRLWIPEGLRTVRGILVVANWAGGDTRDILSENWYGEFMHLHDFAFVGTKGFGSHVESVRVLEHALQQIASDAHHPELVNAPLVTTGFSAGGGFASRLLVEVPNRVIASAPVGSRLNFTGVTPSAANLGTPACLITGEAENVAPLIEPVLEAYRPQGALFGWATVQGHGHERCGQEVLAMPFLDTVTRLRYPASGDARMGPVRLKPLLPSSGWIADNSTWSSGLASIVPAAKFSGEIGRSSWLPTKDLAFVYRAYATYNRPLGIVSPPANDSRRRVWDPGSNVTIVIDDTAFQGWQKLEFYDGARRLGVVTKGLPQLTATNLQPGYHAFSVLGTDLQGAVRPSAPVLVVVRRLPTDESKVHKGDPIEAPK